MDSPRRYRNVQSIVTILCVVASLAAGQVAYAQKVPISRVPERAHDLDIVAFKRAWHPKSEWATSRRRAAALAETHRVYPWLEAVGEVQGGPYAHVGVVRGDAKSKGLFVVETVMHGPERNPIEKTVRRAGEVSQVDGEWWVDASSMKILRLKDEARAKADWGKLAHFVDSQAAAKLSYSLLFDFFSEDATYCAREVFLAYAHAGILLIDELPTFRDLHLDRVLPEDAWQMLYNARQLEVDRRQPTMDPKNHPPDHLDHRVVLSQSIVDSELLTEVSLTE